MTTEPARSGPPLVHDTLGKLPAGQSKPSAGPIAARAGAGATEIRLRVPHLHWPARTGGLDQRTLGVAFQRLVVAPV